MFFLWILGKVELIKFLRVLGCLEWEVNIGFFLNVLVLFVIGNYVRLVFEILMLGIWFYLFLKVIYLFFIWGNLICIEYIIYIVVKFIIMLFVLFV